LAEKEQKGRAGMAEKERKGEAEKERKGGVGSAEKERKGKAKKGEKAGWDWPKRAKR